ncbi:MAG: hypothetical protein JAY84_11115, partial [Candidatus Thiodiazotropha taylori]|nr:hypothetical protein [Candidatus Thiodiazotropha taylori]
DTAIENGLAFVEAFDASGDVLTFLRREDYIPIRCTTVERFEQELCVSFSTDVDGVVIEWNNTVGIGMPIGHLQIVAKRPMRQIYGMLKKHLDLRSFSESARQSLKSACGVQLFYDSSGWETWLGFLPKPQSGVVLSSAIIETVALRSLTELKLLLESKLRGLVGRGVAKNSLAKNNLFDIRNLRILPDDQEVILSVFDDALDCMDIGSANLEKILFSFRFGDRCGKEPVRLAIAQRASVEKITAHIAVSVSATAPALDVEHPIELFWSKQGLQQVFGRRGTLITAYSFSECGNYQSNLDGKMLHISPDLRSVCTDPGSLNFVQLYADTPHVYPRCRFHPVSAGVFLIDGLLKQRAQVDQDAVSYMQTIRNNFEQLSSIECRLEFVVTLSDVPDCIRAESLIEENKLRLLLEKYPLLVPFSHEHFVDRLRVIGQYLTSVLDKSFEECRGTGDSRAVWQTFQYELAVEKMLYGHPLCHLSRIYSINLGPGVDYPSRSKTDSNGFLSLEDFFSCCVDEYSHPPAAVYSKSVCVQRQLSKTFGIADLVAGGAALLGKRLVLILLRDLFEVGTVHGTFDAFQLSMKADGRPGAQLRIVGGTTTETLVDSIASASKAKYPMVIACLVRVLRRKGVDVHGALRAGLRELKLGYFPAVRSYDAQKHEGLYWNWTFGLWVILDVENCPAEAERMASYLTPLVVKNLETLQLCHASTLRDRKLPWVKPCIEKLEDLKLSNESMVTVLTFITCIARLMDGHFIDYYQLGRLESNLPRPVTQRLLQSRQIQDKFLMNNFNRFRLWRLHHSLPFTLTSEPNTKPASSTTTEPSPLNKDSNVVESLEPIGAIGAEGDLQQEEFGATELKHLPANYQKRWAPTELALLAELKETGTNLTKRSLFVEYQKACRSAGIPDRSFVAFKKKIERLNV